MKNKFEFDENYFVDNKKVNPFIDFPISDDEELRMINFENAKPNRYYVTDSGRVFSTFGNKLNEMSLQYTHGYLQVKIPMINGIVKHAKVHRIVGSTFLGEDKNNSNNIINHLDGHKDNNNKDNLEWTTQKKNVDHALEHKLWTTYISQHPEVAIKIADELEKGEKSQEQIAIENNVSKSVVARIKAGSYHYIVGDRNFKEQRPPLTDKELKEIFDLTRNQNKSFEEVAEIYDISPRTVREIYYANSSNFSERLTKMGCIVTEWKISRPLSDQDAIEIFDKFDGNNIDTLAKEYKTTPDTITKVIHGLAKYGELLRSNGRYPKEYSKNLDEEVICNIYKECRAKKKSYQQIADDYGIHLMTVRKIGCAMRGYKDILERNGFIIEKKNKSKKSGMSFEQAKEIYDEAISGKGSRQIASERHIDRGVVDDIKFCRNAYEFLQTEYGLEPMQKKQN